MSSLLQKAWEFVDTMRHASLTYDGLLNYAKKQAKSDRFGNDEFDESFIMEPLKLLTEDFAESAKVSYVGKLITFRMIAERLANIPRFYNYQEAFPEIRQIKIEKPIFVLGLNRSGTTICFRLLSNDKTLRSPYFHEMALPFGIDGCFNLNATQRKAYTPPVPNSEVKRFMDENNGEDPRQAFANSQMALLISLFGKEWQAVHPTDTRLPEEEILMFETMLRNYNLWCFWKCPKWREWFMKTDMTPAYKFFVRFLQQLQWTVTGGKRWLLKMPFHMHDMDKLIATFPDARIVVMHRDPLAMLPSWCSLVAHGRRVFSTPKNVDEKEIGPVELKYQAELVNRMMAFRSSNPQLAERFVDIQYSDIITEPMECMQIIYNKLKLNYSKEVQENIKSFLAKNPKDKHGKHKYSLEQFGITEDDIRKEFCEYYKSGYLKVP